MAGEDLLTYTGQASVAYQDALNQARNAQNALLRQYGFVAPSATGDYTLEGAQAAFDPNTLFDKATGGIDQAKLGRLSQSLQMGGTGLLADLTRSGASTEADVASELQSRGFGGDVGGGLMRQRRALAEQQSASQVGAARQDFIGGMAGALSPIGGAFQNLKVAELQDKYAAETARAMRESTAVESTPTESVAAVTGKPTLGTGPSGEFMKKMNNITKSKDKKAQVANLRAIKDRYALSGQQTQYIDTFLKRLGG